MVEILDVLARQIYLQMNPPRIETVGYCDNPHPQYITEEHCPPKRAPEIPKRGQL